MSEVERFHCNVGIRAIKRKTKRSEATLLIEIPDELAQKLMRQIAGVEPSTIHGPWLEWAEIQET